MRCLLLIAILLSTFPSVSLATLFSSDASYKVCFTPQQRCMPFLTQELNQAKQHIHIQAYSFTSRPMVKALLAAKRRGVDIRVLADKSQVQSEYSSIAYLQRQGVQISIDYLPTIAHNKVVIVDDSIVITGSYNFTSAAELRNAENLLIIHDRNLAKSYLDNWQHRSEYSLPLTAYQVSQSTYDRVLWRDTKQLIRDLMKWLHLLFKLQS